VVLHSQKHSLVPLKSAGKDENDADDEKKTIQGKLVRQKNFRIATERPVQMCLPSSKKRL
jgi:hypothetical protein